MQQYYKTTSTTENQPHISLSLTHPTMDSNEEACLYAMQLASLSVLPMTLKSAIELDLFEIVAKAGQGAFLSPAEIAVQLPTENPQAAVMLDRMLRLLASYNILTCTVETSCSGDGKAQIERKYGAAPVVKFLTRNEDGVSMAAFTLLNQDRIPMESWYYLKDAVLDGGIPFQKAYGMSNYDHSAKNPRFNNLFNEAMAHHSTIITKKILEIYEGFDGLNLLVDLGGGLGGTISMIVKKHPHIRGINFDQPHVISDAQPITGVEHVAGDFFESVPSGDAILMKWILHNWGDEGCLKLLKNCWKVLPESGKIIVIENILPVHPEPTVAAQGAIHMDLNMMSHSTGGKGRTAEEFKFLAKEAGFSESKVICGYASYWVIEFYK